MKKFWDWIQECPNIINVFVTAIRSSQAGFVFVLMGIGYQTLHNYHFFRAFSTYTIEDDYWLLMFETWDGSLFISGALMYFLLKASIPSSSGGTNYDKIKIAENFRWFETVVNLCFHADKLLVPAFSVVTIKDPDTQEIVKTWTFDALKVNWLYLIMSVPLSFAVPYFIKIYAGEVIIKLSKTRESLTEDFKELKHQLINEVYKALEDKASSKEIENSRESILTDMGRKLKKIENKIESRAPIKEDLSLEIYENGSLTRIYDAKIKKPT